MKNLTIFISIALLLSSCAAGSAVSVWSACSITSVEAQRLDPDGEKALLEKAVERMKLEVL